MTTCMFDLKMLGLYLNTLIIGHSVCSMLSIPNDKTLHKELQYFMATTRTK